MGQLRAEHPRIGHQTKHTSKRNLHNFCNLPRATLFTLRIYLSMSWRELKADNDEGIVLDKQEESS